MQLDDHFGVLLRDTVNLSKFRLDLLDDRVGSIYKALRSDAVIGGSIVGMSNQGSWAHRTIINPLGDNEFDADFMLEMSPIEGWEPADYIREVYGAIHRHSTYKQMPHSRKCRCVRLVYANSCHVDIVPVVDLTTGQHIVNRDEDVWERTNPQGFTAWMRERDGVSNGNLRKVIRLMKHLRDHKNSFTGTRSVILTTLLGGQVSSLKLLLDPGYYANVPTTLLHVVEDLDAWLQARPSKPSIADPSESGVTFDHRWDQATYSYFRDRINAHASEMRDAYDEPDRDKSVVKWQSIFGEGFEAPKKPDSSGKFGETGASTTAAASHSGRAG